MNNRTKLILKRLIREVLVEMATPRQSYLEGMYYHGTSCVGKYNKEINMRLTKRQLRRIIRESVRSVRLLHEITPPEAARHEKNHPVNSFYGHDWGVTNRDRDNKVTDVMKARKLQRAKDFWEKNIKKGAVPYKTWSENGWIPFTLDNFLSFIEESDRPDNSWTVFKKNGKDIRFDNYEPTFDNFVKSILPSSSKPGSKGLEKKYLSAKKNLSKKDYWMNDNPDAASLLDKAYELAKTIYPPSEESIDLETLYKDFKAAFDEIKSDALAKSWGWGSERQGLGTEIFERAWNEIKSRKWGKWGGVIANLQNEDEIFRALSQRMVRETDFDEYDENEIFGKYAFSPERRQYRSSKVKLTPHEDNTPIEQTTFDQLKNHKEGKWGKISAEVLKVLIDIQNQKLYADVFPGITDIPVYRGIGANKSFVENLTGKNAEELYQEWQAHRLDSPNPDLRLRSESPESSYSIEGNWTVDLKPGKTVDSWTTSFKMANYYAHKTSGGSRGYNFSLVLQCEMLDNKNVLINLSEFDEMLTAHPESEVIAIGPVKISKIYITKAAKK